MATVGVKGLKPVRRDATGVFSRPKVQISRSVVATSGHTAAPLVAGPWSTLVECTIILLSYTLGLSYT